MIFTRSDYEKIQQWLLLNSKKDSDFQYFNFNNLNNNYNLEFSGISQNLETTNYDNYRIKFEDLRSYLKQSYSNKFLTRDYTYASYIKPFDVYFDKSQNNFFKNWFKLTLGKEPVLGIERKRDTEDYVSLVRISEHPTTELNPNEDHCSYGGEIKILGYDDYTKSFEEDPKYVNLNRHNSFEIRIGTRAELGVGVYPSNYIEKDRGEIPKDFKGLYINNEDNYTPHKTTNAGVYIRGAKENEILTAQGSKTINPVLYLGDLNLSLEEIDEKYLINPKICFNKEISTITFINTIKNNKTKALSTVFQVNSELNADGHNIKGVTQYLFINSQIIKCRTFSMIDNILYKSNWKILSNIITRNGTYSLFNNTDIDTRIIAE